MFLATATKRKANEMNDFSDKISAKKDLKNNVYYKKKVEKENDNGVKYNFIKKKSKFTNKSSWVAKHRSTNKGREKSIVEMKEIECQNYATLQKEKKHLADERNRMSELHKNPEGKEKHCADERNGMSE